MNPIKKRIVDDSNHKFALSKKAWLLLGEGLVLLEEPTVEQDKRVEEALEGLSPEDLAYVDGAATWFLENATPDCKFCGGKAVVKADSGKYLGEWVACPCVKEVTRKESEKRPAFTVVSKMGEHHAKKVSKLESEFNTAILAKSGALTVVDEKLDAVKVKLEAFDDEVKQREATLNATQAEWQMWDGRVDDLARELEIARSYRTLAAEKMDRLAAENLDFVSSHESILDEQRRLHDDRSRIAAHHDKGLGKIERKLNRVRRFASK